MGDYNFVELDELTRQLMERELRTDIATNGSPYFGTTLTDRGRHDYVDILSTAIASGDESGLVAALGEYGRVASSPADAARKLGRTEFNRYYIRAICLRAAAHNTNVVIVYRAHGAISPRPGSISLDGTEQSAPVILANLRGTQGMDATTGLGRVNSGLTIRCGCASCNAA